MKFAKLSNRTSLKVMMVEIDEMFISQEAMNEIKQILELDGKTAEELTAIRNTIVRTIAEEFIDPALDENNVKEYRMYETKMSGITATIDHELFTMGALY